MDAYRPVVRRLGRSLRPYERAREKALRHSRDLVQVSGRLIRGLHRNEWNPAAARSADALARRLAALTKAYPYLAFHGAVLQALGEYCEAHLLRAHVLGREPPKPEALGAPAGAYLHGLGDLVGELRRVAHARLLQDDLSGAEAAFDSMEKVYEALDESRTLESLVPLRAKVDAARALVERTRGELVTAKRAKELERKIEGVGRLLDEAEGVPSKRNKTKKDGDLDLDAAWNKS